MVIFGLCEYVSTKKQNINNDNIGYSSTEVFLLSSMSIHLSLLSDTYHISIALTLPSPTSIEATYRFSLATMSLKFLYTSAFPPCVGAFFHIIKLYFTCQASDAQNCIIDIRTVSCFIYC